MKAGSHPLFANRGGPPGNRRFSSDAQPDGPLFRRAGIHRMRLSSAVRKQGRSVPTRTRSARIRLPSPPVSRKARPSEALVLFPADAQLHCRRLGTGRILNHMHEPAPKKRMENAPSFFHPSFSDAQMFLQKRQDDCIYLRVHELQSRVSRPCQGIEIHRHARFL